MDETKELLLNLFDDLLNVRHKESFHLIAQEILGIFDQIDFYSMKGAEKKSFYVDKFEDSEYTWGMTPNPDRGFALEVLGDVNRIL